MKDFILQSGRHQQAQPLEEDMDVLEARVPEAGALTPRGTIGPLVDP